MEVKNIKTIVGNNLKYARKQKELQKEVAALLRKYQPDYSQYQTGTIELDY
jgi:hypothetical protein